MNTHSKPNFEPDIETATKFLEQLRPGGPWVLTAIEPEPGKPTITLTARSASQVEAFILNHNGRRGIYFSTNPTRTALDKKSAKTDIAAIEFALADLDPKDGEPSEDAKRRYLAAIDAGACPKPTLIVDSGNGIQLLWKLAEPIPLPDPVWGERAVKKDGKIVRDKDGNVLMEPVPVLSEAAKALIDDVEPRIAAVMERMDSVAGTQNIDRILRLPGCVNLPNEKKRKAGRVPCMSRLIAANEGVHGLDAFPLPETKAKDAKGGTKGKSGDKSKGNGPRKPKIVGVDELRVSERIKTIITTGVDPESDSGDRSTAVFDACLALAGMGYPDEQFIAIFLDEKLPISAHVLEQSKPSEYLARQIAKAREKVIDSDVADLNKEFAFVVTGGKSTIIRWPKKDEKTEDAAKDEDEPEFDSFELWNVGAFLQYLGNRSVFRAKGRVQLGHYWMSHHQRRQYAGLEFDPSGRGRIGYYNLWQGFAVEPKPGDCSLFLNHVRDVICSGDAEIYRWVMAWLAQIFQQPHKKLGTSLVLRGGGGAGKSIIGAVIRKLLGEHFTSASQGSQITGKFNAHLKACLFLLSEEAFWAGDKQAEGAIKELITGEWTLLEHKGKDVVRVRNYTRLFVVSNENWVVPAGMNARRFAVFDVAKTHMGDIAYFAALMKQMESGGYEALLYHLLHEVDLSGVDLRNAPKTDALLEQKIASFTPEQGWLMDLLQTGFLPWGSIETVGNNTCPAPRLFDRYTQHARVSGSRHRAIATQIGIFLKKMIPALERHDGLYKVWNESAAEMTERRGSIYHFPPLAECRKAFSDLIGQPIAWAGGGRREWQVEPMPDGAADMTEADLEAAVEAALKF